MIASLRGTVIDMGAGFVVVECGGVGHLVQVTAKTAAGLTRGEEGFLRTALVVREDAMILYGFGAEAERDMFDVLQTVSGLGPKLAMAVLQVLDPAEIALAVNAGDGKKLQMASGVGKRMADRPPPRPRPPNGPAPARPPRPPTRSRSCPRWWASVSASRRPPPPSPPCLPTTPPWTPRPRCAPR